LTGAFTGQVRVITPTNNTSAVSDNVNYDRYVGGVNNDNQVYLATQLINATTGEGNSSDELLIGEGYSYIEIIKYLD